MAFPLVLSPPVSIFPQPRLLLQPNCERTYTYTLPPLWLFTRTTLCPGCSTRLYFVTPGQSSCFLAFFPYEDFIARLASRAGLRASCELELESELEQEARKQVGLSFGDHSLYLAFTWLHDVISDSQNSRRRRGSRDRRTRPLRNDPSQHEM